MSAERENRVLAEMTGLALSAHEYADVVQVILRLVEQVLPAPLLFLSIRESQEFGHYARLAGDADAGWAEGAGQFLADEHERRLKTAARPDQDALYERPGPAAWFIGFSVHTRSGRTGSLALGAPEPHTLSAVDRQALARLAAQAVLVLDHALLLVEIEEQETADRLTGVANLRRMLEMLDYEMRRHRHGNASLSLMLLDVEGLDGINRSYGRTYGNHILRRLATLIQDSVRPIDVVARTGLDELAVMLPETDVEEAGRRAEFMHDRFTGVGFAGGEVGLSIGVAHVQPDEALSPEDLLRRAERALLETKRQQRSWSALVTASTARGKL